MAVSFLLIAGATGFQLRGQILHLLGADLPVPGSTPVAIGNTWTCPSGWLKTYQSGMVYYPSYHPAQPPLGTRPTRCYRTEGEARSAGYKLAPPPKGGALLDGVYLVPASGVVKTNCQGAAAQLGIGIPCPTLLPSEVAGGLCSPSSVCTNGGAFVTPIALTTPPDYPGAQVAPQGFADRGQVLLELWAAPLSSRIGQQLNQCARGNSGPIVMEHPTHWTTCSAPSGESSSWLTWEINSSVYVLGAAPPVTPATRRMVQFFASKLVLVAPANG
jgi:hypothetical protein